MDRQSYYQERNKRILTVVMPDVEFKDRLRAAAERDGRTINNWVNQYVVPAIAKLLDATDAPPAPLKGKKKK